MKAMTAGMTSRGGMSRQEAGMGGTVGRHKLHSFWIDLKLAA